jgi:hypothetical protein
LVQLNDELYSNQLSTNQYRSIRNFWDCDADELIT